MRVKEKLHYLVPGEQVTKWLEASKPQIVDGFNGMYPAWQDRLSVSGESTDYKLDSLGLIQEDGDGGTPNEYPSLTIILHISREETDNERKKREEREARAATKEMERKQRKAQQREDKKARQLVADRATYERLKKRFEGE